MTFATLCGLAQPAAARDASKPQIAAIHTTVDDDSAGYAAVSNPAAGTLASLPHILSETDAAHYAAAFALQEEGNWAGAAKHVAQIKDKMLIGDLLAQRYLSHAYHTSFAEARDWLVAYGDLPEAHAIWKLARQKAPRKASVPKPGKAQSNTIRAADLSALPPDTDAAVPLPREPRTVAVAAPSHFQAGLDAWRGRRFGEAAKNFEIVANAGDVSGWYVAAGAFWAARAHLLMHDPGAVDGWLELAAQQPRTFYGLLSRRLLDMDSDVASGPQPLSQREQATLQMLPGGRRALALVQIGETDRAEAELRSLSVHARPGLANAIVALADMAQMPALCEALVPAVSDARRRVDAAYPTPRWTPRNGYTVDRALMFALMMQESNFNADAENNSGAAGLMQLMPRTAKAMADRAGIKIRSVDDLVDPELNLSLGQEYVRQLLAHQSVNGNLILMLAAYNGGTGALNAMLAKSQYADDPLLFIESLPHQEMRLYVERVLANMWIYRQRLGQPASDLDALAANKWPTYSAADAQAVPQTASVAAP